MATTRALITGISGMVGSHLADYLLANTDWDIHGLIRWRSSLDNLRHLVPRINSNDRVFLHYGDLSDSWSLLSGVEQATPDYVFHLAAQSYPKTSFVASADTYRTNIVGTSDLLEAVRRVVPDAIVHVCASSEVFGRVPAHEVPINESVAFHPASPYAISKVGTDLVGRYFAEAFEMTVMTTRMFTHTGPRRSDVFAESSFAKQIAMIEQGYQAPVVRVGNTESMRTFCDVRDAVRAYHMLVTVDPRPGECYNVGGKFSCTVGDMLNSLIKQSSVDQISVEVDPARLRPIDADLQIPDTSKFSTHTGWVPEISFDQTMDDLLTYWREKIHREGPHLSR